MRLYDAEIVFHGTTSNHEESLKNKIDLTKCALKTDFGKGFYVTTSLEQACIWAETLEDMYNSVQQDSSNYVEGVVFTYTLNKLQLSKLDGKIFYSPGPPWAQFISLNRSKKIDFEHDYDFVYGAVGDNNIKDLLSDLENGRITIETFTNEINCYPDYDQLSLHNENALKCIEFYKAVSVDALKKAGIGYY